MHEMEWTCVRKDKLETAGRSLCTTLDIEQAGGGSIVDGDDMTAPQF